MLTRPRRRPPVSAGRATLAGVVMLASAVTLGLTACTASNPAAAKGTAAEAAASSPAATPSSPAATAPSGQAAAIQSAFVSVINRVLPSVVEIRTGSGLGSGVVFDAKGDIVTNAHVVGSATSFQVYQASSASPLRATLVGKYQPDDLAVVKVNQPGKLKAASFGDSAKLEVGDLVLAIGNPLGLAGSATEGIVSAVGRTVPEPAGDGSPGATLPDTIQTSAAINPGNSGGALVSLAGQVVGIPTLAATDQQLGGGAAPGIGFAISSDMAMRIARQLVANGHVTSSGRAALGVEVATEVASDGTSAGVGVVSVTSGGPAAKAGLRAGDLITAVNGTATPDTQTLSAVLANLRPGQVASVRLTRADGGQATVKVTLGQLPGG
ncbi:MAG TPA: trypsin-like peptidase domain-containing protein [Streptosporangiaceae bacterium]|nr:trypsin-like peptidase domain-containing protein [Streptosporangiaceae bacterium]